MSGISKRKRIAEEFDAYYSIFDPDTDRLLSLMEHLYAETEDEISYLRKAAMHELLCETCKIHLFRESPFFFEISSGRERHTWGGLQSPVGTFFDTKNEDRYIEPYVTAIDADRKEGFLHGWRPTGIDHHCLGYDKILTMGFEGILEEVRAQEQTAVTAREKMFCQAAARSINALCKLQLRFAKEARTLAAQTCESSQKQHFEAIAAAASQVPAKPARTFYEALCAIIFCREVIGSIEGIGVSTFGQLDRMLFPYYKADADAGRITFDEAKMLIHALFLYTDTRFELQKLFAETSTTIIVGGCDRTGAVNYNDVTKLILEALYEGRYINTKVNCRISSVHPQEYFHMLAQIQGAEIPSIVMQNDDVTIPARVRRGQAIEDVRLYVSGGCHEIVLANTEVCTRADTWINLPRLLLATLETCCNAPSNAANAVTYDAFYAAFLTTVREYYNKIISLKNKGEALWCDCNPLPLYSSTITGCLENRKDITEGGAKYSTTALSFLGTATFIDSLYSIKHLVYDSKQLTLQELWKVLQENYVGFESLHQYIVNRIPKYGTNNVTLNTFGAKILEDISHMADDKYNARGGKYLPAFYPHDIFRYLGSLTGATPDGRKSTTPLSRGCSPSEFIQVTSPLDIINSLETIDFTAYADSFCAELTLPRMDPETSRNILTAIMKVFLEKGGSTLQFNLLSYDRLADAQTNPEQHKDLVVRVCGYSAVFVFLEKDIQNEIMERAIR